ncbi:class C sortase [Lacticaseibacillus absianus]|uniref:class C sortase n=1 Tax=Lacticaseibacillus absianus TaxID=2729623 RepID=UPI0015CE909C|nr:class C sortase [Lacticaseibacillus absianus]
MAKRSTRGRVYNAFFTTTLLIGVLLFLAPFLFNWQQTAKREQATSTYEQAYLPPAPGIAAKLKRYNEMIYAQQQKRAATKVDVATLQPDRRSPIGYLNIPSIKLKMMPLYFGDSDWVLNRALGTLPFTSLPTGGKNTMAGITGHSGLANRIFFDNIRYLQNGDVVYINAFGQQTAYQVYARKVVDPAKPSAVRAFYVQPGQDRIALMTCTPLFVNSHRLIVYGKRISMRQAKATVTVARDLWRVENLWLIAVVAFLLLLLIAWWLTRRRAHAPVD